MAEARVTMCRDCLAPRDMAGVASTTVTAGVCYRCKGQGHWQVDRWVIMPRLAVRGVSPIFSTSKGLDRLREVVWDVNGYYRDLGVPVDATRVQLRDAYQERMAEPGADADRLTYVLKQLLDPEVRAAYNKCKPGELYFDEFLRRAVLAKAMAEAAARMADSHDADDTEHLTFEEMVGNVVDVLDKPAQEGQPGGNPGQNGWGYYLWESNCTEQERLSEWRNHLCESSGEGRQLGVGYFRGESSWAVCQVEGDTVVFLHESVTPTNTMATMVMDTINQMA